VIQRQTSDVGSQQGTVARCREGSGGQEHINEIGFCLEPWTSEVLGGVAIELRVTDVGQTLDVKMQLLIISQQLLELLTVISQRYVVNTLLLRSLVRLSVCLCPSVRLSVWNARVVCITEHIFLNPPSRPKPGIWFRCESNDAKIFATLCSQAVVT